VLTDNDTSVKIKRWDGRELVFTVSGSDYTPPAGESSSLSKPGGSNFVWRLQHGTTYTFSTATGNPLARLEDRQGNYVTFTYNASGFITNVTDSASRQLKLQYDGNSRVQYVIDPLGRTNTYAYTNGRLTSVSDALGTRVSYAYDDANNPDAITRVIDARNNTHRYVYNAAGEVIAETNALSAVQTYTWDVVYNTVTVTNFNGVYGYTDVFDDSGRLLSYTNAVGNT
jgi:YD repeat-containing protein